MPKRNCKKVLRLFKRHLGMLRPASTREDLVYVEENYWIAFHLLRDSDLEEHRTICARCLEAIAHILDMEGRSEAGRDILLRSLRKQARCTRKRFWTDTHKDSSHVSGPGLVFRLHTLKNRITGFIDAVVLRHYRKEIPFRRGDSGSSAGGSIENR